MDFVEDRMAFSSVFSCFWWCSISLGRHTLLARLKANWWSLSATTESESWISRLLKVSFGAQQVVVRWEGSGWGLDGGLGGRAVSSSSTKRCSVLVVRARLVRRDEDGCWVGRATTVSWVWLGGGTSVLLVSVSKALTLLLLAISSSAVSGIRRISGKVGSGSGAFSSRKSVTLAFRRPLYL